MQEQVKNKKKLYNKWLNSRSYYDWREYRQRKKDAQRTVIKAKKEAWKKTGEEIEKSMGNTRANRAWKVLKNMKM